jgi:hypothetical protein
MSSSSKNAGASVSKAPSKSSSNTVSPDDGDVLKRFATIPGDQIPKLMSQYDNDIRQGEYTANLKFCRGMGLTVHIVVKHWEEIQEGERAVKGEDVAQARPRLKPPFVIRNQ